MKRRLLSAFLAVMMVLTMAPVAFAGNEDAGSSTAVAKIGDTTYESLNAAIAAVQDDETIELLKNVDHAEGMSVNTGKTFTVDFKGHTYTVSKPGAGSKDTETNAFQLITGQNITFKNGTICLAEDNLTASVIPDTSPVKYSNIRRVIQCYAALTLEDMTIDATNVFGSAFPMSFNNQPVNITGNTSVILKPGTTTAFDADGNWGPYGRCTVTVNTTGTIDGDLELGSGYLDIKNVKARGVHFCTSCGSNETTDQIKRISITGGTFATDVSAYVAEGYVQNENGTVEQLGATNAVAEVGNTYYKTLAEAVSAADNNTVTLLKNTVEDVVIPADKTITLDLNGKKIVNSTTAQDSKVANDARKHTITNNGTLTIMDSVGGGVVDNVSHGRAALYNNGTITEIKGGKFTRSVDNSTDSESANGNSWYVVYNAEGATISKISNGEFLALGHFSSLFSNCGTIDEISGGTFTQDHFIAFKNEGTVNKISGGVFSSADESCIQNWGTIGEICGGTITAGSLGIWNLSSDTER